MKAILCHDYGPPDSLTLGELPDPEAGPGKAVIEIHAAGANFVDALCIQGTYQIKPPLPFIPGMELAGVVRAVGEGVSNVASGDRVACLAGIGGAFAEQIAVRADRLVRIPDTMDFDTGAGFSLTYCTSLYALENRGHIAAGDTLLVLGAAGGVGLAAVDLGKALGARVIAAASSDEKLAKCREFGADAVINYDKEDLKARVKELTGGAGVDLVYDPVGGDYSETALRTMGWNGRFLVIGFANGAIPRIPINLTLLKGCEIVGVDWGQFGARFPTETAPVLDRVMQLFEQGKINPCVTQRYSFEDAPRALNDLLGRKVVGKAVIRIRD